MEAVGGSVRARARLVTGLGDEGGRVAGAVTERGKVWLDECWGKEGQHGGKEDG